MQLECVKNRKVSADVIGHSNEEDLRHLSSDVEVPYSPGALPSADRFANFNYLSLFLNTVLVSYVKLSIMSDITICFS